MGPGHAVVLIFWLNNVTIFAHFVNNLDILRRFVAYNVFLIFLVNNVTIFVKKNIKLTPRFYSKTEMIVK